jgi:hypothetical protein
MDKKFLVVGQIEVREIITAENSLSAENKFFDKYPSASIVDTPKEIEESQVPQSTYPHPKYVMVKYKSEPPYCALERGSTRYSQSDDESEFLTSYYRVGGEWELDAIVKDGKLIVHEPDPRSQLNHIHGCELVEVTRDEWGMDNRGYTGDPKYDGKKDLEDRAF